jgi:hypothetical protein
MFFACRNQCVQLLMLAKRTQKPQRFQGNEVWLRSKTNKPIPADNRSLSRKPAGLWHAFDEANPRTPIWARKIAK